MPDITENLVSVGQLAELNYALLFKNRKCIIFDPAGRELMTLPMTDRAYYLSLESENALVNVEDSTHLWHKRLGHVSYKSLNYLQKNDMVKTLPVIETDQKVCEICQFGKQTRLPFPSGQAWRASERLQLVHSDVCGPQRTLSLNGSRYFLLFIDDLSRMTWVYFLKQKSEVATAFWKYKALVENQSGCKIKAIRTDNGTEYTSDQFEKFCTDFGIEHQLTVVYTPQQNGVCERKNMTVMEMSRCLLFEKSMPKRFWAEAVNTSVYLLNRLPTKAVKRKTPYEVWFREKPAVNHIKVFGSV